MAVFALLYGDVIAFNKYCPAPTLVFAVKSAPQIGDVAAASTSFLATAFTQLPPTTIKFFPDTESTSVSFTMTTVPVPVEPVLPAVTDVSFALKNTSTYICSSGYLRVTA